MAITNLGFKQYSVNLMAKPPNEVVEAMIKEPAEKKMKLGLLPYAKMDWSLEAPSNMPENLNIDMILFIDSFLSPK
eukprot:13378906-Ditylum_brightwellii.AAC.1